MSERDGRAAKDQEQVDVDISLIDASLRMTPIQRLRQNDRMATTIAKLRDAFERRDREWKSRES
jgi:hypothetical protein